MQDFLKIHAIKAFKKHCKKLAKNLNSLLFHYLYHAQKADRIKLHARCHIFYGECLSAKLVFADDYAVLVSFVVCIAKRFLQLGGLRVDFGVDFASAQTLCDLVCVSDKFLPHTYD